MRLADRRVLIATIMFGAGIAQAQSAADGPVLGARHLLPTSGVYLWVPDGTLKVVGWDRDSVLVRGRVGSGDRFFFGGSDNGVKGGVEQTLGTGGKAAIVLYVPRQARVSIKTATTSVTGENVSGSFYSVSGNIRLSGTASSIEAETMTGSLDIDLRVPWLRARTGDGHLLLRGAPEDVDVSTVAGTLDVATTAILRGQFSSVSGAIHYIGAPASRAIMEFSSHSGDVELMMPRNVSGVFSLTSIAGAIDNGLSTVRPTSSQPRSVRLSLGNGGSQVTVRTFKGSIRLRPQ